MFWGQGRAIAAVAIATAALAGCGRDNPEELPAGGSAFGAQTATQQREQSLLDVLAPLVGSARPTPRRARGRSGTHKSVSALDRDVAQLFLVGFEGTRPRAAFFERLRVRGWGAVLLSRGNYVEPAQLAALAGETGAVARGAGYPAPLVAAQQLGGEDSAFPNLPPSAQPLISTAAAARTEAVLAGRQLRALGIHMTLAPSANLGTVGGPWEGRAFSDAAGPVARMVRAAVGGYSNAHVAAAPGNFPGEGAASQDPYEGAASVGLTLDELRAADLGPFEAIARKSPAIAMSDALYAAFDGVTPATLLPDAVTLLRELGFQGVVVSGDLATATLATGGTVADAAVQALAAGCDLLYVPGDAADQEAAWRAVVQAVRSGAIPARRIATALKRVTALKRRLAVG